MKLPTFYKNGDIQTLEEALSILPHHSTDGLATVSQWQNGLVIKLRIKPEYTLEQILPPNYTLIERDKQSILFETGSFRYYTFHQR